MPYVKTKDKIYLTHTEVSVELEGKGVGSKLVKAAQEDIEKRGMKPVPMCPFVAGYIKSHPEWRKLVLKGINKKFLESLPASGGRLSLPTGRQARGKP